MSTYKKLLLGGIGGLIPTIATLAIADAEKINAALSMVGEAGINELYGHVVRVLALFTIGAIWVFFHKSENDPVKLIQLGIVAPAMITGMVQASNVEYERSNKENVSASFSIISEAYAGEHVPKPILDPDPFESFIKGLLGR